MVLKQVDLFVIGTGISVEMNQSCGPEETAPRPGALLPSPTEVGASGEESPPLTSVSRNPESFRSTAADAGPDSEGRNM